MLRKSLRNDFQNVYSFFEKAWFDSFCFYWKNALKHFIFINTVLQSSGSFHFPET